MSLFLIRMFSGWNSLELRSRFPHMLWHGPGSLWLAVFQPVLGYSFLSSTVHEQFEQSGQFGSWCREPQSVWIWRAEFQPWPFTGSCLLLQSPVFSSVKLEDYTIKSFCWPFLSSWVLMASPSPLLGFQMSPSQRIFLGHQVEAGVPQPSLHCNLLCSIPGTRVPFIFLMAPTTTWSRSFYLFNF